MFYTASHALPSFNFHFFKVINVHNLQRHNYKWAVSLKYQLLMLPFLKTVDKHSLRKVLNISMKACDFKFMNMNYIIIKFLPFSLPYYNCTF